MAAKIEDPEFRPPYRDLAKYLDMFGPCRKQQARGVAGWWLDYPESPGEAYCFEVAKLLASNMLWSQVHYCRQLMAGDAKRRLDKPPVQTEWLKTEALYAVA